MKKGNKKFKSILKIAVILLICIISAILIISNKKSVKEISKEKVILAQTPIYALDSNGGISAQQGNLLISTESTLELDTQGPNRNTLGIGEKVVFTAQFDKIIKETRNCKLTFKFGDGTERTISAEPLGTNKNEVVFKYTIQSPDNGELKVTALSGTIVDEENLEVQIGLPSEGKIIFTPKTIIADTTKTGAMENESSIIQEGNTLKVTVVSSEKLYIRNENILSELSVSNSSSVPYIGFTESDSKILKGKNQISNYTITHENGKTKVTFDYAINEGDEGTPIVYLLNISDIAGNTQNIKYENTSLNITATNKTPYIIETPELNIYKLNTEHKDKETLYLLEGDKITVKITFNEKIYSESHYQQLTNASVFEKVDELTLENAKSINIKVGNTTKPATATEISSDGKTVTYTYTVADNDDGQYNGYTVPSDIVVDNVGRKNIEKTETNTSDINVVWSTITEDGKNETTTINGTKVIIDAKAPSIQEITDQKAGIEKEGGTVSATIVFTEPVTGSGITGYFSDSPTQTRQVNGTANNSSTLDFTYEIKSGDNGKACITINAGNFKDAAGNTIKEESKISNNQYADTEKPKVAITPSIESGSSVIRYNFTLTDNSDNWTYSYDGGANGGTYAGTGGIKSNSFIEEDITIPPTSTIIEKEYDSNGNLSWIEVQSGTEGVQTLLINNNKFEDIAGNQNDRTESNSAIIDRIAPRINSVTLNPNTWTNQSITVTVDATDSNGIKEYSYDDGQTWEKSKTKVVQENTTLKIKVKDNADNISQTEEVVIDKIDKLPPEVLIYTNANAETAQLENGKILILTKDQNSGIAECTINGQKLQSTNEIPTNVTIENINSFNAYIYTATQNGTYTIIVTDNAGNQTTKTVEITNIDTEKPEITNITLTPNTWTNKTVRVTITANDSGSGVKDYSYNQGTWTTNNYVDVSENQTLNIKVRDNNDNILEKEINISNIDKVPATIQIVKVDDKITIQVTDNESGIASLKINDEEEKELLEQAMKLYTTTIDGTSITNLKVEVQDNAGNITTETKTFEKQAEEIKLEVTENEYIKVISDINVDEDETIQYIVLSKEMATTELTKNLKQSDGEIIFESSNQSEKTNSKLATGDTVYAENSEGTESNVYIIILKGDVNSDGTVDINDMFQINKCRLGNITFEKLQKMAGDVNDDSMIDIDDLFQINKYRLKRITNF